MPCQRTWVCKRPQQHALHQGGQNCETTHTYTSPGAPKPPGARAPAFQGHSAPRRFVTHSARPPLKPARVPGTAALSSRPCPDLYGTRARGILPYCCSAQVLRKGTRYRTVTLHSVARPTRNDAILVHTISRLSPRELPCPCPCAQIATQKPFCMQADVRGLPETHTCLQMIQGGHACPRLKHGYLDAQNLRVRAFCLAQHACMHACIHARPPVHHLP